MKYLHHTGELPPAIRAMTDAGFWIMIVSTVMFAGTHLHSHHHIFICAEVVQSAIVQAKSRYNSQAFSVSDTAANSGHFRPNSYCLENITVAGYGATNLSFSIQTQAFNGF